MLILDRYKSNQPLLGTKPCPLTNPKQELFEILDRHAAGLDWTAEDLAEIARRIEAAGLAHDARALVEMSKDLKRWHEIILSFADEVQENLIIRKEI